MSKAYVIGTCDTKGEELAYAKRLIEEAGVAAVLVDVGTREQRGAVADVSAEEVASSHPRGKAVVLGGSDRGAAIAAMAEALAAWLAARDDVGAVLGLGGSGNTALVTAAMRALPVGVPKLMVSTVASGNAAPYVGPSDIALMYSVTDVAGLNAISRKVIGNAAHAVAGMAKWTPPVAPSDKPGIGITMFSVTTDCVTQVRRLLESDYETYVFHATGTGGQSMEKLAESGFVAGMIDVTTTEVADLLVGGVFPCTEDRFGAAARTRRRSQGMQEVAEAYALVRAEIDAAAASSVWLNVLLGNSPERFEAHLSAVRELGELEGGRVFLRRELPLLLERAGLLDRDGARECIAKLFEAPAPAETTVRDYPIEDYPLQIGDELLIAVTGRSQSSASLRVGPDGAIVLRRLPAITAVGKTTGQIRGEVAALVSDASNPTPRVVVILMAPRSPEQRRIEFGEALREATSAWSPI